MKITTPILLATLCLSASALRAENEEEIPRNPNPAQLGGLEKPNPSLGGGSFGIAEEAQIPRNPNPSPRQGGLETPNPGGGFGNPEDFRQRMNDRLKTSLKVSDEEWTAIQPLIEKVQNKLRDSMMSRFGGRGRAQNPGADPSARAGATENEALKAAVEADGTNAEDLKTKLEAVREQRKKSAAELATAREDLRKVLTVRQEAALVSAGILE